MMQKQIHSDGIRTIIWEPGIVKIYSHTAKKELPILPISNLICDAIIQPATLDALKKAGHSADGYMAVCRFGKTDIVAPADIAKIIYDGATRLENEYRAECDRVANLPENRERREISNLFSKANRIENSESEDNVWLPAALRAEARKKLAAWREKYPEAARKEAAGELLDKASDLRSKASGAMVYDADGWLDEDQQKKRHDDFIKEAEALEAKAMEMILQTADRYGL